MQDADTKTKIREQVSSAYTHAIKKATEEGCCGSTPCDSPRTYYEEDAAQVPDAAVQGSFGCGNPIALAGLREGETVVDLGSGAGLDLIIASQKVGPTGKVIGVDMTPAMIDAARRNLKLAGVTNTEVREGLIENLPAEDASADWVISNCVINLSPDKPKVFSEIHRVLKPGGRFSVYDMVVDELPAWLRELAGVHAQCIGGAISEADYIAGLEEAGMVDVKAAETREYEPAQVREIVKSELKSDIPDEDLEPIIEAARVKSIRFTGRRPEKAGR